MFGLQNDQIVGLFVQGSFNDCQRLLQRRHAGRFNSSIKSMAFLI